MNRVIGLLLAAVVLLATGARAQQSEYAAKMKENLDKYVKIEACGLDNLKLKWTGAKFTRDPNSGPEGYEDSAVSWVCTAGLDTLQKACSGNAGVKKAVQGVKKIRCTDKKDGKTYKGTLVYELKDATITFFIDPTYNRKHNLAEQSETLSDALKHDLDGELADDKDD